MIRMLVRLALVGGLGVAALDGGSIMLTRLQLPDDVRTAGHVAATNASGKPINRQSAVGALAAARTEADKHDITVQGETFILQPDGRITLTGTKSAPTLLAGRISALRDLTEVASTTTVGEQPFR